MYVMVGSHRVEVVVEHNLKDGEKPVSDIFRPAVMQIALDAQTPRDNRRTALVNALDKAWDYAHGPVDEDDEDGRGARRNAIDQALHADLVQQHGEGVLHVLFGDEGEALAENMPGEPIRVPYGSDDGAAGWPTDVACPGCNKVHKTHEILNGSPYFDLKMDGFSMVRAMHCLACDKNTVWVQRCSYDGEPWPKMVSGPNSIRKQLGGDAASG